jgi:glutamate--cysteine ligase
VRIGSLLPEITEPTTLDLPDGQKLLLEPLRAHEGRLGLDGFDPCAILLNNDLSAGVPEILQGLHEQFLIPPLHAGWHVRRKSRHFAAYDRVAIAFAGEIGIDPWLINPSSPSAARSTSTSAPRARNAWPPTSTRCSTASAPSTRNTASSSRALRHRQGRRRHLRHGHHDGEGRQRSEVGLNRKQRNKMAVVKEGLQVTEVIIQEGVHTFETVEEGVAEPVVYMIDRYVVGGFYRVHTARGRDENLNAPGMHLQAAGLRDRLHLPDAQLGPDAPPNRFYAYGVVARLAMLAASLELERDRAGRVARWPDEAGRRAGEVRFPRSLFILDPLDPLEGLKAYKDSASR